MSNSPTYEELARRVRELELSVHSCKQQEEELRQFRDIVSSTPDGIALVDKRYRYLIVNDAYVRFSGIRREEIIGGTVADLLGQEVFAQTVKPYFDRCLHGEIINSQQWFDYPARGKRFMDITYSPYRDRHHRIAGVIANSRDITERRRTEEAATIQAAQLRLITDHLPAYIAHVGIDDLRYTFVNERFVQGFNIPRQEIIGKHIKEIIGQANYEVALPYIAEVRKGKTISYINSFDVDQGRRWIRVNYVPDRNSQNQVVGIVVLSYDITEVKATEEKYLNLFEKMLDGFALHEIICDAQGVPIDYRFLSINPAFEHLTGLRGEEIIGKTVREVLPGTERHWIDTYGHVALSGESIFFESYSGVLGKHFAITAYRPASNQFACIFQDVTARKEAEEALRERNDFLDKIINASALSMWISDEQGTAIRANPACLAFFGAREEEVIGKYNLFQDAVIRNSGFMPAIRDVYAKGEVASIIIDYDFAAVDHVTVKNATHKIIKSVFTPVLDNQGKVANVIVQAIDLTDIKRQEEALRKSEERYRLLYTNTPAMLHSIDPEGRLIDVSNLWLAKLGYHRDEVIGRQSTDFLTPESRRFAEQTALPEFFRKGYINEVTYHFVKKNGEVLDALLSAITEKDEAGAMVRALVVLEDVTEKNRLEAQLRHTQKMEAIGTLSGGIAHDFNNILAAILGFADMARDDIPERSPARIQLEEVLKAGNRAKNLVKQILSFSRKAEQHRIPLQITSLIKEGLGFLRASIPTTIQIRPDIDSHCGQILADPTQIHQVIMNLCTNAPRGKSGCLHHADGHGYRLRY